MRIPPFPQIVRYISSASPMPRTNSMPTETTVMMMVTSSACHQNGELRMAP